MRTDESYEASDDLRSKVERLTKENAELREELVELLALIDYRLGENNPEPWIGVDEIAEILRKLIEQEGGK